MRSDRHGSGSLQDVVAYRRNRNCRHSARLAGGNANRGDCRIYREPAPRPRNHQLHGDLVRGRRRQVNVNRSGRCRIALVQRNGLDFADREQGKCIVVDDEPKLHPGRHSGIRELNVLSEMIRSNACYIDAFIQARIDYRVLHSRDLRRTHRRGRTCRNRDRERIRRYGEVNSVLGWAIQLESESCVLRERCVPKQPCRDSDGFCSPVRVPYFMHLGKAVSVQCDRGLYVVVFYGDGARHDIGSTAAAFQFDGFIAFVQGVVEQGAQNLIIGRVARRATQRKGDGRSAHSRR